MYVFIMRKETVVKLFFIIANSYFMFTPLGKAIQMKVSEVVEIEMREERDHITSPDVMSPPGTRTPTLTTTTSSIFTDSWSTIRSLSNHTSSSSSNISSLHIDDSVGIAAPSPSSLSHKISTESYSGQNGTLQKKRPKANTIADVVSTGKLDIQLEGMDSNRKRSRTEEPSDVGVATKQSLVIFECKKTGELKVFNLEKNSDESGYRNFDSIFMTPLAEAVACGHSKVAKFLLNCGARDESGLACRIAHFIKKAELLQTILSYHTTLRDSSFTVSGKGENTETGTVSTEDSTEVELCLELQWSYKQLPVVEGKWLTTGSKFNPAMSKDQEERRNLMMAEEESMRSKSDKDADSVGSHASLEDKLSVASLPSVGIESLRIIQLDNNQLHSLPVQLFRLQNVIKIDVSHNKLVDLPSAMNVSDMSGSSSGWACPNLKDLNLSHNLLTYLPWCVWGLPKLRILRCSRNKLTSLYPVTVVESDEIITPSLEVVDLSQNSLSGFFPDFVFDLPGLRTLNLSENRINELPVSLWDTDILQDLNMSGNCLEYLPMCEPEKRYRESISMSGSFANIAVKQADKVLVGKTAIKAPKIDRNKSIYNKAPSTIQGITSGDNISWNNVGTAEAAVLHSCNYSALQKLNLSANKIAVFPEALACFAPNLQELDLSRNSSLKEIDVMFIPYSLKKLTAKKSGLQRIGNIAGKKHHTLAIQNCRHKEDAGKACTHRSHNRLPFLTTLVLAQNKLKHLQLIRQPQPEDSQDWLNQVETEYQPKIAPALDLLYPSLEGLNLSSNQLMGMFNPNIGHLTHLKWIHLNGNTDLTGVPMEFAYLKNTKMLTELKISDLPSLMEPPVEYQNVGLNHLLTYMRSRLKE